MRFRTVASLSVASVCALLLTTSCRVQQVHYPPDRRLGNGPPPHARAYGYRCRQMPSGVELVYDSVLGVYVVVGFPEHYYYGGHFYRFSGTVWEVSLKPNGDWASVHENSLPPGLMGKVKIRPTRPPVEIAKLKGKGRFK